MLYLCAMLEKEVEYFNKIKPQLVSDNPNGGFAVIKEETLLGVWINREDALKEGVKEFGNVPFLVKDIFDNPFKQYNYSRNPHFVTCLS